MGTQHAQTCEELDAPRSDDASEMEDPVDVMDSLRSSGFMPTMAESILPLTPKDTNFNKMIWKILSLSEGAVTTMQPYPLVAHGSHSFYFG